MNENSITYFLLKNNPIARKVNMVTALTTDAERPAIKANVQRRITIQRVFINVPYFILSIGFKRKDKINKIIPTCKPETAKI